MIQKMDFIKLTDATILYLKLNQKYNGKKLTNGIDIEKEMFWAINGGDIADILTTVAHNMQDNRPGINYIYNMRLDENKVETHISSEVIEHAFPQLLNMSLDSLQNDINSYILEKKVI